MFLALLYHCDEFDCDSNRVSPHANTCHWVTKTALWNRDRMLYGCWNVIFITIARVFIYLLSVCDEIYAPLKVHSQFCQVHRSPWKFPIFRWNHELYHELGRIGVNFGVKTRNGVEVGRMGWNVPKKSNKSNNSNRSHKQCNNAQRSIINICDCV
jgi:hypothetical protein